MGKFTLLLLAVPLYADVMTFNDRNNYFVGQAQMTVVPTNSFNFDLAPLRGAHITGALLQVKDAYGSFDTVRDPKTRQEVRGPFFDYALSAPGWTQHFVGLCCNGSDLIWDDYALDADGVDALNSMTGGHLHITGTLVIPSNAIEYFLFDGSDQARLTLQFDGAARERVSSLQFDPAPEPATWLLMAPLVLVVLRRRKRLV